MHDFFDIYGDDTDVMEREDFEEEEQEEDVSFCQDIPAGAFFVKNGINDRAKFTMDEVIGIVARYRGAKTPEEADMASTDLLGIVYPFMVWLLKRNYSTYWMKYREDLLSAGLLGFSKGIVGYDPASRNPPTRPSTWFKPYIQHECDAFINSQVSHTSAHYVNMTKKINACVEKKKAEGKEYTDRDICIEAGVSQRTLESVAVISGTKYVSMSASEKELDIPSDFGDPVENAIFSWQADLLYDTISDCLEEKEQIVMYYKYGLNGTRQLTAKEIEQYFGIKETEVGRIAKSASAKLVRLLRPYSDKPQKKRISPSAKIGEVAKNIKRDEQEDETA